MKYKSETIVLRCGESVTVSIWVRGMPGDRYIVLEHDLTNIEPSDIPAMLRSMADEFERLVMEQENDE